MLAWDLGCWVKEGLKSRDLGGRTAGPVSGVWCTCHSGEAGAGETSPVKTSSQILSSQPGRAEHGNFTYTRIRWAAGSKQVLMS